MYAELHCQDFAAEASYTLFDSFRTADPYRHTQLLKHDCKVIWSELLKA